MTHILVVDSNPADQSRYRDFLTETGWTVSLLDCGEAALESVRRQDQDVELAIVLWELQGQPSGSELVTHLRRVRPELPVVVVSGLLDLQRAVRARELGAVDFVLKPLDRRRLATTVRRALTSSGESELFHKLTEDVVGESPAMMGLLQGMARVIPRTGDIVLLTGETGTGKELLAQQIHRLTPKQPGRLVDVNVASIPTSLMATHLFGNEAGAFTDARRRKIGVFEESGSGTLFLDEIGELELHVQAELLRVIQERRFRRIGGTEDLEFSARLILATNRDLLTEIDERRFRQDLYFRISEHEIRIPPLRDRGNDVWLLSAHFLRLHAPGRELHLARETRKILSEYAFSGNVRELSNLIKHAVTHCDGDEVLPYHLPVEVMGARGDHTSATDGLERIGWPQQLFDLNQKEAVAEIETVFNRAYLKRRLEGSHGNVTAAARASDLDPKTFRRKWKEAGLGPLGSRSKG